MTDFANGLKSLSGNRAITPEASDFLHDAAEHIDRPKSPQIRASDNGRGNEAR